MEHRTLLIVLGAFIIVFVLAGVLVIVLARVTRVRRWRVGIFYESEDRFDDQKEKEEGKE